MMRSALVLVLVAAACEKKSTEPGTPSSTAAKKCAQTVDDMLEEMSDDPRDRLYAALLERCRTDAWNDRAQRCFERERGFEAWRICAFEHLSKDDADRFERAVQKARKGTAKLTLTELSPDKGDAEGGTFVVLKGSRFIADGPRNAKVYFGSRQGQFIRFQSDSDLIVQAPGGKAGDTVDVLVIFDPGGQLVLSRAFTFVDKSN